MKKFLAILAMVFVLPVTSQAVTLTFDGLPDADYYTGTYTEAGFDLIADDFYFGTEGGGMEVEPSCCDSHGSLTIQSSVGDDFTFSGASIQREYGTAQAFASFAAYLDGILVGTDVFSTTSLSYVSFDAFFLSSVTIDKLVITGDRDSTAIAIDDVVVEAAAVPEPSTIFLLGSGLVGLAFWRRRQA